MLIGLSSSSVTQRPERLFQNAASRRISQGVIAPDQEGPDTQERVTLSGREGTFAPLRSLSGHALVSMATESALKVASGAGLPAMVTSRFAPAEFLMLNCGDYHGAQHPINVASATQTLAENAGVAPERAEFLRDVALLHDADERILIDGAGHYSYAEKGVKARVPLTLAFMDLNRDALAERMGWSSDEFLQAKALIAGTEHPLNDTVNPGRYHQLPDYDGKSAAGVLREQLAALPKESQAQVLEELQIMRFADQSAEYFQGVDQARESVKNLQSEIEVVPYQALLKGTPGFIDGLGRDNEAFGDLPVQTTHNLAKDLGLEQHARLFSSEELRGFMSPGQAQALAQVRDGIVGGR